MENDIKFFMKHISALLLPLCFAADVRTSAVPAPMFEIWAGDTILVKSNFLPRLGTLENSSAFNHATRIPHKLREFRQRMSSKAASESSRNQDAF
jgi:hypothetical protein